jgi:phosphopantothenoylcysteine decarboxylase / phosphopantothenate---cysteine ligase
MDTVQRVVLGITGGIAAYKTPELLRLLAKNNVAVKVVLTPDARPLVGEETLRVVSCNPVYTDVAPASPDMAHIELAKWGQLLLVCPATANTIAKITHGIADNLLTTLALSFENRIILAPAMNTAMWNNAAVQANVSLCASRGAIVLPVDEGELACGDEGPGRLLPVGTIADYVLAGLRPRTLSGKKVLISSGPTQEPIDPVRVITNRSSGKMGAMLSRAAMLAGADVCVVSGPAAVPPPPGCRTIGVISAREMKAALDREFGGCDICIMAAAVSDFSPRTVLRSKKHRSDSSTWNLSLSATPDILEGLGRAKTRQVLVGFSLDTAADKAAAAAKMSKKNCDMMIANPAETAMEGDATEATILARGKRPERIALTDKRRLAEIIIDRIASIAGKRHD